MASIMVGAAALASPEFFREFVVVEKHEFLDERFRVGVAVVVTEDFVRERRIEIPSKDVILKRQRSL